MNEKEERRAMEEKKEIHGQLGMVVEREKCRKKQGRKGGKKRRKEKE